MKKLIVTLTLVVTALATYAQKPTAGTKGFTFGISNIFQNGSSSITNNGPARTGTLLFRYYVADGLAARLSVNYSRTGNKTTDTVSVTGTEMSSKYSSSRFAIQLGAQKSLGSSEKFEPYIGLDLLLAMTGGKTTTRSEVVNANGGGTVGNFTEVERNGAPTAFDAFGNPSSFQTPGMQYGVIPTLGFNYYFTENFALGAEFGWGIILSSNKKTLETKTTTQTSGTQKTTTTYSMSSTNGSSFGPTGNGTITVSIFF